MKSLNRSLPIKVTVIGAADCAAEVAEIAFRTGQLIGEVQYIFRPEEAIEQIFSHE